MEKYGKVRKWNLGIKELKKMIDNEIKVLIIPNMILIYCNYNSFQII